MSEELLELAASSLGDLLEEVVFVGGATISLWITDSAAPPPRVTKDVDVIVEVATRTRYFAFEEKLRNARFDGDAEVICRWHHRDTGLILDAMPTDGDLLGFENRWQSKGFPHAVDVALSSGARIRVIPPPYLLATKLEAFGGRGGGDLIASRDFADIVAIVDGRVELIEEMRLSSAELNSFIAASIGSIASGGRLHEGVAAQLPPDFASQERAERIVIPRMETISGLTFS
jgi:hypothetical protein